MYLAFLVCLVCLAVVLFFRSGSRSRGNRVVLFGPEGGGKTALALQIRFGRLAPTLPSMQTTTATCTLPGERADSPRGFSVELVDVPGSGRLRAQLLVEAGSAGVLVCVLDATAMQLHCKEAAGILFDVLSHSAVCSRALPLVVVLNKCDVRGAANLQAARLSLEGEVQKVRLARTTMKDTSDDSKLAGGIADMSSGSFSFDQMGVPVEFVSTSALQPNLHAFVKAVSKWIK
uniref:Signal recognition particle receptor subunit beta n=1 Tax=Calcidiscus leptoporus TaxID=127549 RepID=A0A6U5MZ47_9EUKA|mmetsp:Transcript_57390/g.131739  ORF Transcript_57390/g.131739 Transcript_57390/m.131739 type:complete len:232 (+) Transcript_57390:193-888(+)